VAVGAFQMIALPASSGCSRFPERFNLWKHHRENIKFQNQ
jgi:hypothetical protein